MAPVAPANCVPPLPQGVYVFSEVVKAQSLAIRKPAVRCCTSGGVFCLLVSYVIAWLAEHSPAAGVVGLWSLCLGILECSATCPRDMHGAAFHALGNRWYIKMNGNSLWLEHKQVAAGPVTWGGVY